MTTYFTAKSEYTFINIKITDQVKSSTLDLERGGSAFWTKNTFIIDSVASAR